VAIRFSTIPDSPVSPFQQATVNTRLSLLGRAMGRAYIAFCPPRERRNLIDMLARSPEPEDASARDRARTLAMLSAVRRQGHAERDPLVEPRSSGTIAVPIIVDNKVLATAGMSYFKSAVRPEDLAVRYVPLMTTLGRNIASSVQSLR
jgi:IclR family mhp operon transcriptional activator